MVDAKLLHLINKSCRDMFPNIDESFAGIHVYIASSETLHYIMTISFIRGQLTVP